MSFQTPITIKTALDRIQAREYVLPAIQREFVWQSKQICGLFDSLMRGYPIGGFLFWKVQPEQGKQYPWYGFLREYHANGGRHCPKLDMPHGGLTAILDGQQRLTSLNIGLRGSHAEKEPHKRWANPEAFPKKFLYLNLAASAAEDQAEQGFAYDFRFMTSERAIASADDTHVWFKVADVLDIPSSYGVIEWLQERKLGNSKQPLKTLHQLYKLVHEDKLLPYYEEVDQDLDKVLNIFIRVNSGGTPLAYSDLLLSIATSSWDKRDARSAVHDLVDELSQVGAGFRISQDLVLKTGLMLAEIESIAFRVSNFTTDTMQTLDEKWDTIARALRLTVKLLADFGYSGATMSANSVAIPIAYYLHRHGMTESFLTAVGKKKDREKIRRWVNRSLVKAGVWGSGLDTLLLALREAIRKAPGTAFPVEAVEKAMEVRGKPLRFSTDEIDDLLDSSIQDRRAFPLLALMYPYVDLQNHFHIDHVFPASRFTRARLIKAGVAADDVDENLDRRDRLANLQLLDASTNQSKQDAMPADWLKTHFTNKGARAEFCERHDLGVVAGIDQFGAFYDARRELMRDRLIAALGADAVVQPGGSEATV